MYKYFLIVIFFCSCFSEKKAERNLNKIYINYPEVLAKRTSQLFPCITETIKIDSSKIDSSYKIIETRIEKITDTINRIGFQIDTIKDISKIKELKSQLINSYNLINELRNKISEPVYIEKTIKVSDTSLQTEINSLCKSLSDYRLKYERCLKAFIWVLGLLCVSILINVIKLK